MQLCNRPAPKIRAQAMVSFPHWTATTLMHKEAGLPQVTDAMVHDADIAALRAKVVATADEKTGRDAAHVKVMMKDGRVLEAHCKHALSTPAKSDDRRSTSPTRRGCKWKSCSTRAKAQRAVD